MYPVDQILMVHRRVHTRFPSALQSVQFFELIECERKKLAAATIVTTETR